MKLSPNQVSQISQKISSNQVYYTDIRAELTDHIACKIEAELHTEDDFEEVLQKSLAEVNPKKFQRSLLIQAHLNSLKDFLVNLDGLLVFSSFLKIPGLFNKGGSLGLGVSGAKTNEYGRNKYPFQKILFRFFDFHKHYLQNK